MEKPVRIGDRIVDLNAVTQFYYDDSEDQTCIHFSAHNIWIEGNYTQALIELLGVEIPTLTENKKIEEASW